MTDRESQAAKIAEVAARLGTESSWLDALINFETGGTYDPLKPSDSPTSTARGLIQINDMTASDVFGYPDSESLVRTYPTFDSQMDHVVLPYFIQRSRVYNNSQPYTSKQALCMAVFYPTYINKHPTTPFPPAARASNPGINTPQDYIAYVDRRIRPELLRITKAAPALLLLVVAAGGWWYLTRKRHRGL